jgi:hypothetical protein
MGFPYIVGTKTARIVRIVDDSVAIVVNAIATLMGCKSTDPIAIGIIFRVYRADVASIRDAIKINVQTVITARTNVQMGGDAVAIVIDRVDTKVTLLRG